MKAITKTATGKPCPAHDCTGRLVEITNGSTGEIYLGCDHWPNCKHKEPLPADRWMKRQNAPRLF